MNEPQAIAMYLDRLVADILKDLADLSDELLNWVWPVPDANTLFAIATHTVGMGEFWVLGLVGDQPIARDRAAEFRAVGHGGDLIVRLTAWNSACQQLLGAFTPHDLDRTVQLPEAFWRSGGFSGPDMSVREALWHVVEHTATHLGHIQLGRQIVLGIEQGVISVATRE